jgi:acid phosphatase
MESMPSPCYTGGSSGGYAKKHDPFMYFTDVIGAGCASHVLPYPGSSGMLSALNGSSAPGFVWITPNLTDDMHDGSVLQGDAWLKANIDPVLTSSWFTNFDSTVVITMDEQSGGVNQVPFVVISNNAKGHGAITSSGNDYGALRAIEEEFGLGLLGAASNPANGDPFSSF